MLTALLERLGLVGPGEDGVGERATAVGRRVVLVEVVDQAADVVAEARRRDVEVEEDDSGFARVAEGVHDARRRGDEGAGSAVMVVSSGSERELERRPSSTKNASVWCSWMCASGPFWPGS